MRRTKRSAAWWRKTYEEWKRSGKTGVAFCAERGLSTTTFWRWCRRLRKEEVGEGQQEEQPLHFVPLQLARRALGETRTGRAAGIEIVGPRGYRIRLDRGFDPDALLLVLTTLERRAC